MPIVRSFLEVRLTYKSCPADEFPSAARPCITSGVFAPSFEVLFPFEVT